jgi:tetratricopeptide (TPR) repeat protein
MASTVESTVTAPTQANASEQPAFLAWFEKHRKLVSYGTTAVLVVLIGAWLFRETGKRKEAAATDALERGRAAFESGNLPSASTEFQRVTQSYSGTDAAFQAELGLNEVRLASGQTQIAVDELRKFVARNPPAFYSSGAYNLMGGALENLKKFDDAAQAYRKAADIAAEDYRKVDALLGAARALRLAGKDKESIDVLRGIVSKFGKDVAGVAEAQVRLAERTGGTM